ncbi:hypothetical protein PG997_009190 [Apiospora hydei]|uniref:Uncharacterized protein n=1 Tax=Apiospora hydei TaxID=1337664 RepID=A0ABR1VUN5_9PEZI
MSQLDDIHYSRDETISAVREFYTFLSKMYIDESDILEPPEGGWPHMENLRCIGKTDEVMELLRRLPYLRNKHPEAEDGTTPCPWGSLRQASEPRELVEEDVIPPSVVGLTYNRWRDGKYFLLDTERGIVHWYECPGQIEHNPDYPLAVTTIDAPYEWAPENEQEWRENYPAWAVADLFAILRQQFEDLNFVPLGPRNVAEVFTIGDDNREVMTAVQNIYRQHGWPDLAAYQKEDCLRAVRKLVREDFPEHIKHFQGEDYED